MIAHAFCESAHVRLRMVMPVLILCDWSRYEAEQAFLREYYRADVMLLPYKYNMNLAQAAVKVGEA